jgi:hypothetical protein
MRPIKFSRKEMGGAVVTVFLALASLQPMDPHVVFPMLVGSWLGCLFLAFHHEGSPSRRFWFCIAASGILAFIGYRQFITIFAQQDRPPSLYLGCNRTPPPIRVKAGYDMVMMVMWGVGFSYLIGPVDSAERDYWTDGDATNPTTEIFRCDLKNDSSEPIFNVRAPLSVEFSSRTSQNRKDYYGSGISAVRIDPNGAFTFYMWNGCHDYVGIKLPDKATISKGAKMVSVPIQLGSQLGVVFPPSRSPTAVDIR